MSLTKEQAEELTRLLRTHRGHLKPEDVVEASRPEESTLHTFMCWHTGDDELAARYRLDRARLCLSMLRLREAEETSRPLMRIKDEQERVRLSGMLEQMKKQGARRLINYADGRRGEDGTEGYRDVVQEFASGREGRILRELLRELTQWVNSRGLLHPEFHSHMLCVLTEARRQFGNANDAGAA